MQRDPLNNIHIQSEQVMITPAQLKEKLPISDRALAFVQGPAIPSPTSSTVAITACW
jgi:hypothetical protein